MRKPKQRAFLLCEIVGKFFYFWVRREEQNSILEFNSDDYLVDIIEIRTNFSNLKVSQ